MGARKNRDQERRCRTITNRSERRKVMNIMASFLCGLMKELRGKKEKGGARDGGGNEKV